MSARHGAGSLVLASLLSSSAVAAPPSAVEATGRFLPFQPLGLEDLYVKRMRFTKREPIISVGLMEGQPQVTVSSPTPLRIMFDEDEIPKIVYAPPGARFTMRPLKTGPAVLRWWVVVHSAPVAERAKADALIETWKAKGLEVHLFETGTIIALRGNVLDTREVQVAVGGLNTRAQADALMLSLKDKTEGALFLHEELVHLPSGQIAISDERGVVIHKAEGVVYAGTVDGGRVKIDAVEFGRGYKWHGREDRLYRGHAYVVIDDEGKLAVVNSVGAEDLLAGLVPAEIFSNAPIEALKAQAVTARGEIFSKLAHRHFGQPYHLCSEQHCQVYSGVREEQPATNQAVLDTRGLLAFRPRKSEREAYELVDSVYSSSCGGFSEANEVVWGTPPSPSLRPRLDGSDVDPALSAFSRGMDESNVRNFLESYPPTACARSTFAKPEKYRWKKTISAADASQMVADLGVGRLQDVKVLGRGAGGRVTGVAVVGSEKTVEVLRELPVRRLFGNLNSGFFVLDVSRDARGDLTSLTFTGGGWGHGVGMCQTGAIGRAEQKQTFRQILAHYYGGAVVEAVY